MEVFKLFGSIFVDSSAAQESISKTEEKAESMGSKLGTGIKTAAKWGAAVAAGAAVVGGAMMAAATKIAGTSDEIDKASRRAGTTAETWQKLNYAMGQSGISSETLERTMVKNQKALNEAAAGSGKAASAYESLGVSIRNADGTLRDSDQVYQDTLKSLADLEDKNLRNALANDIFGKSYSDLAPILDSGSAGIDQLTSRAEQLGLVLSQETVDAGVKFGDTLDDVKQVGGAVFNMFAAELLPILQGFLDFIINNAPAMQEKLGKVVEFIMGIVTEFKAFWAENGEQIIAIAEQIFSKVSEVISVAMDIIKGIINTVLAIIRGDWSGAWEGFKEIVSGVFKLIGMAIQAALDGYVALVKGIGSALYAAGKAAFQSVWDGMKSVWESISSWVSDKVEWLADKLTFWNNSKDEMDDEGTTTTTRRYSHAAGIAYVPYDGYQAELHRGETVLNASNTTDLMNVIKTLAENAGGSGSGTQTINLVVEMDGATLARQTYTYNQKEAKIRGVSMVSSV